MCIANQKRRSSRSYLRSRERLRAAENMFKSHASLMMAHSAVGKNVTHRASNFQEVQQLSTNGPQQIQYQLLRNIRLQQVSIGSEIWFGPRCSEVQILSPRPILSFCPFKDEIERLSVSRVKTYPIGGAVQKHRFQQLTAFGWIPRKINRSHPQADESFSEGNR